MLWDTAGQEEFDAITKAYYRGAQACVLAFSTVDRESFEAVEQWKRKVSISSLSRSSSSSLVITWITRTRGTMKDSDTSCI